MKDKKNISGARDTLMSRAPALVIIALFSLSPPACLRCHLPPALLMALIGVSGGHRFRPSLHGLP